MNHLHVRCPSCAKLYQVDPAAIFSTSPHFQCVVCPARFTFDFPPENPEHVLTRLLEEQNPASVAAVAMRKCPRCGSESPAEAKECYSCQVIFEKLEGLPEDPMMRTQPSLVRRWKEILEDYTNDEKHEAFVMACQSLDALEFARSKYEHIRKMQGQDEIATAMIAKVDALAQVQAAKAAARKSAAAQSLVPPEKKEDAHPPLEQWRKIALATPFVISLGMILWGFLHINQRNMIGTGIAVALLSYGLIVSLRGRLTLRDFLR